MCLFLFFFFQAEDGIRDLYVTGVQTCALPICSRGFGRAIALAAAEAGADIALNARDPDALARTAAEVKERGRSEERRVGKECRSRWSPSQSKKKQSKAGRYSKGTRKCARTTNR